MEPVIWMMAGAGGVICLIIMRLGAKHGWSWVQAQVKQHAAAAEADFKAKVSAAAGDLAPRVRRFHAVGGALHDWHARNHLELPHLHGDRGRRDMQNVRCGRKAPGTQGGGKSAQLAQSDVTHS